MVVRIDLEKGNRIDFRRLGVEQIKFVGSGLKGKLESIGVNHISFKLPDDTEVARLNPDSSSFELIKPKLQGDLNADGHNITNVGRIYTSHGAELGLQGNGGGRLILANDPNDNAIYLEGFSSDKSESANFIAITGKHASNLPELRLYADKIFCKGNVLPRSDNAYDLGSASARWRDGRFAGKLSVGDITEAEAQLHVYASPDNGILVESSGDSPRIILRGYDGTNKYSTVIQGGYHGRAIEVLFPAEGYYVMFEPPHAIADNTLVNPARMLWRGKYWDGSASKDYDFEIVPEMLDTTPNGRLRFRLGGSDILELNSASGIKVYKTVLPSSDNALSLGSESLRWANVYAVNIYAGDINLDNGWRITEYDENGKLMNGVRILNAKGKEVLRITNEGVWFKGKKIAE